MDKDIRRNIIYGVTCVIYVYMICLLLAGAIQTASSTTTTKLHRAYDIGSHVSNDWNNILNCAVIFIFKMLYSKRYGCTLYWVVKHGRLSHYFSKNRKCSGIQCLSNLFSIWTSVLNLVLIVICNTGILNPGPNSQLNVLYQNVRGFVPFSGLGKRIMPLNTDKVLEFQSKVFKDKPDVIILTETWLSKEHLNSEILPDDSYKIYRRDRSKRTHPPDPDNPKKFRSKGGGVLVAVKADIDIHTAKVDINSKAEMLSVSFDTTNLKYCISVCYRVGTLGVANLNEIERHIQNIASCKKFRAHFIVGDFNLPDINWSDGHSPSELGQHFIELFNNFGLTQLINQSTHEKGKILDLLLSNMTGAVDNVTILDKNEICTSDFPIILVLHFR